MWFDSHQFYRMHQGDNSVAWFHLNLKSELFQKITWSILLFIPCILICPILKTLHLKPELIRLIEFDWSVGVIGTLLEKSFLVADDELLLVLIFSSFCSSKKNVLEYWLLPSNVESCIRIFKHTIEGLKEYLISADSFILWEILEWTVEIQLMACISIIMEFSMFKASKEVWDELTD